MNFGADLQLFDFTYPSQIYSTSPAKERTSSSLPSTGHVSSRRIVGGVTYLIILGALYTIADYCYTSPWLVGCYKL